VRKTLNTASLLALTLGLTGGLSAAFVTTAQAADAAEAGASTDTTEEVIVTGTRLTGLTVADSPAPIQVLGSEALKRVGQTELGQALAQNVPSFTVQAFGGDTAGLTLSAKLRGLSPNHALVLVNGKRRHTTANLAVLGGPYQGGAAADLNFIPVASVERVEVLQDGAAAQYGTDAIAGVINIILKKQSSGGSITGSGGAYFKGDGITGDLSANFGFEPSPQSYLNVTLQTKYHDFSDRGGIDPRVIDPGRLAAQPNLRRAKDYPNLNKIQGDARYQLNVFAFNGGYDFGEGLEFYTFGTYGKKYAAAYENYRMPSRIPGLWPNGFSPMESLKEDDYALAGGFKGTISGWDWDLSSTYGSDRNQINVVNSGNASLYADKGISPTAFNAGTFIATQWTNNFQIVRGFDVGMATPLNVALGLEQRKETYEIRAGDAASRYKEGSQSYPGFALTDAGDHSRDNTAAFIDLAVSPVEALQLSAAARFEHFSDFGDTTVGKLGARYDFSDAIAIRGTASTGFRAPTLAESYYSATNVSPTSAYVQLPPNSAAAKIIGINGLKPEKSTNYSVGIVAHPAPRLTITADLYQIDIKDRIAGSGTIYSGSAPGDLVTAAIVANGNVLDPTVTNTGINIFANGLDTRTRGAEFVLTYTSDYGVYGGVDWSLTANYNETVVTNVAASPRQLGGQSLYDKAAIANIETASPKYRITAGGLYSVDKWVINLRESLYGPSSDLESPTYDTVFLKNEIGTTLITDLDVTYKITDAIKVTAGANNLFDIMPDKKNAKILKTYRDDLDNSAVAIYPGFSPFGINGGYYYGKISYAF
jgi:iron complex outermembrane receptor protein